jgi:outer membrane protein assembly factor BamD (BamD/ComL family)
VRTVPLITLVSVLAFGAGCASSVKVPEGATPSEIFAMAKSYEDKDDFDSARTLYEKVYEDYPTSEEAREAGWLAAGMSYRLDDIKAARKEYQDFHDTHPLDHLGELADRMYDIGVRLYEDGQSGLIGLGILTTTEEGIETLTWLTEKLENSTRADDAFFYMGRVRLEAYMYEEAILFLDELIERYPQSEWRFEARFLKGEAHFRMNRGPAYDLESLRLAQAAFEGYLREVKRSPEQEAEYADRIEEAKQRIAAIRQRIAEKDILIADFYESVERPRAVRIYLRDAVTDYGNTEAGVEAGRRLDEMEPEKDSAETPGEPKK